MGWHRKLLRVNLSAGTCVSEPLNMEWAASYLGQRGLATKYLMEEIDPAVDAPSPDNKLGIVHVAIDAVDQALLAHLAVALEHRFALGCGAVEHLLADRVARCRAASQGKSNHPSPDAAPAAILKTRIPRAPARPLG